MTRSFKILNFKVLIIYIFSLISPFYLYEGLLTFFKFKQFKMFNESIEGLNEFKENLEAKFGQNVVKRQIGPAQILNEDTNNLPLGGYRSSIIPFCNENGYWEYYISDELGFNNLYKYENPKILLIGDSFAEGYCVKQQETLASYLTYKGLTTYSLGKGGNSSLIEFATLKEFYEEFDSEYVIWLHYENDIYDIDTEYKNNILSKYLDSDFKQNLLSKNFDINNFYDQIDSNTNKFLYRNLIKSFFKITYTRQQLRYIFNKFYNINDTIYVNNLTKVDFEIFNKIINKILYFSEQKEFKFIFIYLPSYEQIYEIGNYFYQDRVKEEVFMNLDSLGVNYYDLSEAIFSDKEKLYFPGIEYGLNLAFHYNSNTYLEISDFIETIINE